MNHHLPRQAPAPAPPIRRKRTSPRRLYTSSCMPVKRGHSVLDVCTSSSPPDSPLKIDIIYDPEEVHPGPAHAHKVRRVATATEHNIDIKQNWNWKHKTYAQRYQERLAVYWDAEDEKKKEEERRLGSPFESDLERSEADTEDECEGDFDMEITEVEMEDLDADEDDEMLLLPCGYEGKQDGYGCGKPNSKDKNDKIGDANEDRQAQPQLQPKPPQPTHSRPRIAPYPLTQHHAPLSNDTISNILLQCKPQSPQAQTWIATHEANKAAQTQAAMDRERMRVRGRHGLRRQVLQLRPKSEWNVWRNRNIKVEDKEVLDDGENQVASASVEETKSAARDEGQDHDAVWNQVHPGNACIPAAVNGGGARGQKQSQPKAALSMAGFSHRGAPYFLNDQDRKTLGVLKTSARLQVAASDREEYDDISGRVKQELRTQFGIPGG
ncbi:uncharacterized protein BDV17DRAFT_292961 [Aspergillus undulatus]|uniref:uncharacterized protein n=1 Tax=Aspergillus undulatus TaxID=1810928 RepID=UPI003CCD32AF